MKTNISEEKKTYIVEQNMTLKDIQEFLNISAPTARLLCKRNNIIPHKESSFKYLVNDHYFKNWSEEMAYFLGLLAADGYVRKQNNYFSINLIEKDIHIIECMKKAMGYEGPIYKLNKKDGQNQACLRIASIEMVEDLESLGLSGHKTYDLDWIKNLPEKYVSHFVRGIFCGDGCIYINEENQAVGASIVGTHKLTENIKNHYNNKFNNKLGSLEPKGNVQNLVFNGKYNALEFLNWIYKDSTPETRLSRKYELYLKIKNDLCENVKPPNRSIINQDIANEIRAYYKQGRSLKEIESIYSDLKPSLIYDVIAGKSWQEDDYSYSHQNSEKIYIEYNGRRQSIQEWSDETGIPYSTIDRRYRQGLSIEQVLTNDVKRIFLGKAKSEKDLKSDELAKLVREDYKNGLIGKANYEKHNIKKSRYIDIVSNSTNKEETIWWKEK